MPPVSALHHGEAVLEVPNVAEAFRIGGGATFSQVEVSPFCQTNGAASLLKVAAPVIPIGIQGIAIRKDVEPSIGGMDSGPVPVETEGPHVAGLVGRQTIRSYVIGARGVQNGSEARGVKIQHIHEPCWIDRLPAINVVGAIS